MDGWIDGTYAYTQVASPWSHAKWFRSARLVPLLAQLVCSGGDRAYCSAACNARHCRHRRTSAHSTRVTHSLADAILRVAPVRLGVLVACHCSLRGNDRLQLGYKRVIPALCPRYTRVIPAFVGALICCSRTAARLLSFALPSVIYARVSGAGVTTVSSACLCPQLPREFALQR